MSRLAPYMLWIKLGLLVAAVGAVWWHGFRTATQRLETKHTLELADAAHERIAWYEGQIAEQRAAAALSRAQSDVLATKLDRLNSTHAELRAALRSVQLITNEVNRETNCPEPRLAASLRVCRNAATTGSADELADCAAFGVPAPATAGAVPPQ